ncbi:hypothetical protein CYMTET_29835, partial [Cymbomonas tetramitiformis]
MRVWRDVLRWRSAGSVDALGSEDPLSSTAPGPSERRQLLRDFIHDSLYHPSQGYFVARSFSVGEMEKPLAFRAIAGRQHYYDGLDNLYKRLEVSWLTPVELLQPWYARALGRYILKQHNANEPLVIYE